MANTSFKRSASSSCNNGHTSILDREPVMADQYGGAPFPVALVRIVSQKPTVAESNRVRGVARVKPGSLSSEAPAELQ